MKILIVFRSPIGGLFRHVLDLIKGLCDRGHHVGLVFDANYNISSAHEATLIRYASLGLMRLQIKRNPSFYDIVITKKILKWIEKQGFDIIHGHGAKGGLYVRLISMLQKNHTSKVVYTLHGGSLHYNRRSIHGYLYLEVEKLLCLFTTSIIFESQYAYKCFLEKVGQPQCITQVIYNGLNNYEFEPITYLSNVVEFVYLGELRKLKGVDILIQAVHLLQQKGYSVNLNIFGAGQDEKVFKELVVNLSVRNVKWLGVAENARDAIKTGRCLVLPSLAESLPYVVIESVAMGVPVLATNVGGVPEILGKGNVLVIPGSVDDLADKMRAFLEGNCDAYENIEKNRNRAMTDRKSVV